MLAYNTSILCSVQFESVRISLNQSEAGKPFIYWSKILSAGPEFFNATNVTVGILVKYLKLMLSHYPKKKKKRKKGKEEEEKCL